MYLLNSNFYTQHAKSYRIKKVNKVFALFFCLFLATNTIAQKTKKEEKETTLSLVKYDLKHMWGGFKNTYTQPFKWKKKDFLKVGGVVAGTLILYSFDEQSRDFFTDRSDKVPQVLKDFGWYFGSPQNFFMVSAGIYGYGLFTKNEQWRKTGVLIIAAASATGLIQSFTKTAVGRSRPYFNDEEREKNDFDPFTSEPSYHSFPSGHAVLSTTMAHAIAKQFSNIWVKVGIYSVGAIVPISRLWEGAHWLTDVVLGSVLSIVVVDGIDKFLFKEGAYDGIQKPKRVSWNVKLNANTVGLVATF